jgi:hypothetical protein
MSEYMAFTGWRTVASEAENLLDPAAPCTQSNFAWEMGFKGESQIMALELIQPFEPPISRSWFPTVSRHQLSCSSLSQIRELAIHEGLTSPWRLLDKLIAVWWHRKSNDWVEVESVARRNWDSSRWIWVLEVQTREPGNLTSPISPFDRDFTGRQAIYASAMCCLVKARFLFSCLFNDAVNFCSEHPSHACFLLGRGPWQESHIDGYDSSNNLKSIWKDLEYCVVNSSDRFSSSFLSSRSHSILIWVLALADPEDLAFLARYKFPILFETTLFLKTSIVSCDKSITLCLNVRY